MLDDNWELINGPAAHQIEQLNAANVINVIEALVIWQIAQQASHPNEPQVFNQYALYELHRTGTIFLLAQPGQVRDCPVSVSELATGKVVYQAPPEKDVPNLMAEFFEELNQLWRTRDALDVAAFALWRINWIHPFKNGNGRTARAFSYACLSAHLGVILPGTTTIIDQIMTTREEYEACIRIADSAAEKDAKARDLNAMKEYLFKLLQIQMASVPDEQPEEGAPQD